MTAVLPELLAPRRTVGSRAFDFSRRVAVMAIVNRTPDSFWDRGATFELDSAVSAALAAVAGRSDVVISVDTTRAPVAAAAIAAGASVVNDTNGARDPAMVELLSEGRAAVVVTHSLAAPHQHLPRPEYGDVVGDVVAFLQDRVDALTAAGVPAERLFIDPGPDLNKNTLHTLELLRRLPEVAAIGLPMLAAVSNKDFIGETLDRERHDRLPGSLAATTLAVAAGARVVRTHQVAPTVDAVRLTEAVLGLREPAYLRHNV